MLVQNASVWHPIELHTSHGGQITHCVGHFSTEKDEQLTSIGQGAKSQLGGTLPTTLPSGHTFASCVQAIGCFCVHPAIRTITKNKIGVISFKLRVVAFIPVARTLLHIQGLPEHTGVLCGFPGPAMNTGNNQFSRLACHQEPGQQCTRHPFFRATISFTPTSFQTLDLSSRIIDSVLS